MIISVDEDVYNRLNKQLKNMPDKIPDVLRKTINDTARQGKKYIVKHTKDKYVLKNAFTKIKNAIKEERAIKKHPQATIIITGKPEPIVKFATRKNMKRAAAKGKVLQESKLKSLTLKGADKKGKDLKAFMATMKNGNVGVFQRQIGTEMKSNPQKTAIKQLYSTSIPQMVKNEEVYQKIEEDIKMEMRKVLDKHIKKVMEGM